MPLKKKSIKIKNRNNNKIEPLSLIRKKIDRIDNKIHDLIMNRAELVSDVVKEKRSENFKDVVIYRPAREHEILVRLIKRHKGNISIISLISISGSSPWIFIIKLMSFLFNKFSASNILSVPV